ncbi:MAG: DUF2878 domain-containing protein [Acidobacteria bacterium]|nr:DUF2878 domain-containing protein [Acidobacteriota bacterium]MDA1236560.1 DUF2878 domain-containing protein [Acidobacteriota bacterium]
MNKVLNFAAFQAGWFACILGAANGMPWLGPIVVAAFLAAMLVTRRDRGAFTLRMTGAAGIGFIADTVLLRMGILDFGNDAFSPLWMTALWPNLAATLDSSLGWLSGRYFLAALFGAVGGPLAYYAGARLGALRLDLSPSAFAAIACEWLAAFPLMVLLADRTVPKQEALA